ncbi:MAG: hypothetical protein FWD46_06180 [Cystobacterineae bacterium]|nr:hypothetical protein [Cystobacterineae bacterium]
MKRLLRWACLLSQMATAIPQALAYPSALKPQEKPSPLEGNRLDMLAQAVEKALNAWDVDTARLLMLQVEELNLHGLALLHYLQGRMAFQQGLYEEAVSEFVLAGQEDVPNSFLRLAKTGQRLLKNAQRFESAHFVLLLPQGKYAALAPYALEVLEAQYEALKADLGFAPREKLRVEMADNAPMLAGLLGLALEKGGAKGRVGGRVGGRAGEGAGGCAFGKMALLSPSALGGGFAWQNPLAYAYVCLAVAQLTRGQAPPWLQEALAAHLQNRWQRPPAASAAPLLYPLPYPPLTKAEGEALQKHMRASPRLLLEEYALGHSPSPLAFVEGFLLLEYWKAQQGPKAFAQLLEKLSLHGDVQRAIAELSGAPWAKWKQGFRRAVLARRFPKATPPLL